MEEIDYYNNLGEAGWQLGALDQGLIYVGVGGGGESAQMYIYFEGELTGLAETG